MSVEDFARIALRHDTLMSRAMLWACGVPVARWPQTCARACVVCEADVADEVMECFRNRGRSPMDGGRGERGNGTQERLGVEKTCRCGLFSCRVKYIMALC